MCHFPVTETRLPFRLRVSCLEACYSQCFQEPAGLGEGASKDCPQSESGLIQDTEIYRLAECSPTESNAEESSRPVQPRAWSLRQCPLGVRPITLSRGGGVCDGGLASSAPESPKAALEARGCAGRLKGRRKPRGLCQKAGEDAQGTAKTGAPPKETAEAPLRKPAATQLSPENHMEPSPRPTVLLKWVFQARNPADSLQLGIPTHADNQVSATKFKLFDQNG